MSRKAGSETRRGQALVEFALCAVALLTAVLSVVEFGRLIVVYATIANAARVGSRYAMVNGSVPGASVASTDVDSITTNVTSVVNSYAPGLTVNVIFPDKACTSTMPITCTGTSPGNRVQVSVQYPYDPILSYFGMHFTLGSTSEGVITW